MANTKQVKAADVLNTAFAAGGAAGTNPGGDGVSLINTAHPLAVGGTFTNRLATDADLNETSLEQALIDIAAYVDERGLVNHFLTDINAFFIKTDAPNGLKHFVRSPMSTNMEGDFDTGNARYKARERYSFGFSDPRGIFGTSGA